MNNFVSATFDDMEAAAAAVERLLADGYRREDVSLIMTRNWRKRYFTPTLDGANSRLEKTVHRSEREALAEIVRDRSVVDDGEATLFIAGPLAAARSDQTPANATGSPIGTLFGPTSRVKEQLLRDLERGAIIIAVAALGGDDAKALRVLHNGQPARELEGVRR